MAGWQSSDATQMSFCRSFCPPWLLWQCRAFSRAGRLCRGCPVLIESNPNFA
eukprot:jgi/Botrbrau1/8459/Bobra.0237s0076.1